MPAVRKPRRQHPLPHYAKTRARSRLLEKGLATDEIDFEAIEAEIIKGIEKILEIEMVDSKVDKIITKGLKDFRWARPIQNKDSENSSEVLRNPQSETVALSAENSLSPILTGGNKSFADSLRVFLRASIVQFLHVGPGAAPPILPRVPPRTLPTVARTNEDSFPSLGAKNCAILPAQQEPKEPRQDGSWPKPRTVTSSGQSKQLSTVQNQKQKTGVLSNGVANSIPKDDRLFDRVFLRIPRNYEWRSFTSAGIREAVFRKLAYSPTTIDRIIPVALGYAIIAKDEMGRQLLLSLSNRIPEGILLEAARSWVSYILPNMLTHIVTIEDGKPVAESDVIAKIE
ncbi:hypothetical protein EPUL_005891 [Erysiphe pulchra]|uniref:Uncharacterized protein n=1 Tax=Erysiphe pulchra TaxID=225359 RepID=A0A2S4PNF8_9PEZI|nr:hypothetical protein EPUL_005891 [Erysiphe pulchra]